MANEQADQQATFAINLAGNVSEKASEDRKALEELRRSIASSTDSLKSNSAALRSLRGDTSEIKAERERLKALVSSERDVISAANLALLKQGTTYEKVAQGAKKLEAEEKSLLAQMKAEAAEREKSLKSKELTEAKEKQESLSGALRVAGGPVQELAGRFQELKGVLGGAGGAMGFVVLAAAAVVTGVALVIDKVVELGAELGKFIVRGADAARSMNLLRLATTGTAENARNLGTQVDAMADKVSTPKEELNKLAAELGRTRLSGAAIVNTFEAVSRGVDAMGDDVGNTFKEVLTRGQMWNRFQLNPLELQGKGVQFGDVAKALSSELKITENEARARLFEGRVTIDQGAKAMADAAKKRFGEINDAKLLSLDTQARKFHEHILGLTAGVHIEPFLRGLREVGKIFDQTTVAGASLKAAVTSIGNALGPAFERAAPLIKGFLKGMVIGALDVGIAFVKLGKVATKVFQEDFGDFEAVKAGKGPLELLAGAVDILRIALEAAREPLREFSASLGFLYKANVAVVGGAVEFGKDVGKAIARGAGEGVREGAPDAQREMKSFSRDMRDGFAGDMQIHSPSKVFRDYGQETTAGYEQGVDEGSGDAASAVDRMASKASAAGGGSAEPGSASSGGRGGTARAGAGVVVEVRLGGIQIMAGAAADAQRAAAAVRSPSFLAGLTKAVQDLVAMQGLPVQTEPAR